MVDETDLEAAVRSGVLPPDVADTLRNFSAARRGAPAASEERFGLAGGLADVMTAVGLALLLGAALMLLVAIMPPAAILLVPACWMLAGHFTRRRKLTLTSFVLFGIFALAVAMGGLGLALMLPTADAATLTHLPRTPIGLSPLQGFVVASATTFGCIGWWLHFRLPVAYAAATVAGINLLTHLVRTAVPDVPASAVSVYLLLTGVAMLVLAIWWDLSDIRRETRRSDVAFWLHAAAGFQVAGAGFRLIFGVVGDPHGWERLFVFTTLPPSPSEGVLALLLFLAFCFLALVLDRRSLLMSSLAFLLPALARMTGLAGMPGMLTGAMALGAMLLSLSLCWTWLRTIALSILPITVRAQLPRTTLENRRPRPVT